MSVTLRVMLVTSLVIARSSAYGEEPVSEHDPKPPEQPAITEEVDVETTLPSDADIAAFATTIDAGAVRERGQDLADVLRRVPGARVHDYGGMGSYATMSLRASTSEQVTIFVDGIAQNRALGGAVDLSSIPATQIANVTVFRGFGPAEFGLGGIGGVVDVRTRPPGDKPESRIDLLCGELGTVRASADLSLAAGTEGRLRVGAELLRSSGEYEYLDTGETLFNPEDDVVRRRSNNDVNDSSVLLQYVRDASFGGQLRVAARAQNRERGVPGLGSTSYASARQEDSLADLTTSWTRPYDGALERVELSVDGFGERLDLRDPHGELGSSALDQTTRLSGAGVAGLLHARSGAQRFVVRLDARGERAEVLDRSLEISDRGGATRKLLALTAEDLIPFGHVSVAPSLRWEHRSDDFVGGAGGTLPPPAPDVRDDALTGKIGMAWALHPRGTLRGSVGRFYRSPSLTELFGNTGAIRGNPTLRPESGVAAELGYAGAAEKGRWSFEIVGFVRSSDDLIVFLPLSQGRAVARNVSRADAHGLEGSLSLRLAPGWSLDATTTLQEATDVSGGFSDGKPLPYQPNVLGFLGVAYQHAKLRARWDVTYTGPNSTDALDSPEFRLPARVIHDASLDRDLRGGIRVGIDVSNVFDRTTRDLLRYPLPGRVVSLHLGWSSPPTERAR